MSSNQTFDYPLVIREQHLDTFGHVNNATYLQLFEEARWEMITRNGYGLEVVRSTQRGPVILDLQMQFKIELRLREAVIIRTQLMSYDGKIGKLAQSILTQDGRSCCEMTMTVGLFDLTNRRLILPTPAWLKAVGLA